MKKKGFTLVELLVVIAIIAMLLAILMPALAKVRAIAYRLMCGTNLGGLGKAMVTYANENSEQYPVFQGTGATVSTWGPSIVGNGFAWDEPATTASMANITKSSITASLFLLIKYADVSTKQFVCKATSTKVFDISATGTGNNVTTRIKEVTEAWDFGATANSGGPWDYCSYSYQMPYRVGTNATDPSYPILASSLAGLAVMADANPWYSKGALTTPIPAGATANPPTAGPHMLTAAIDWVNGVLKKDYAKYGNSTNHGYDGQNVLYADSHTSFEQTPNTGIQLDNIYTCWIQNAATSNAVDAKQGGVKPVGYAGKQTDISQDPEDSFLAN